MFAKTLFALLTAIVLTTSFVSAHAQRGCVSGDTEEGGLSAYPAWQICKR
jgi:hypothetical protein